MTNEPTWQLNATEDDDGAILEALLAFDDSDVAITVAAADLHDAVRRFSDLMHGWFQPADA